MRPEITQHPPPPTESDSSGIVRRLLEIHLPEIHQVLRGIVMKSRDCRVDETSDLLGEVAKQVIQKAEDYDLHRPFVPWVLGFVGHVLASRQRQRAKAQRQVPLSQLASRANDAFRDQLTTSQQADAAENRQRFAVERLRLTPQPSSAPVATLLRKLCACPIHRSGHVHVCREGSWSVMAQLQRSFTPPAVKRKANSRKFVKLPSVLRTHELHRCS